MTATAGEEVGEIVIGATAPATATACAPRAGLRESQPLPISQLSAYQIQDPIGEYTTNWCTLDAGPIPCRLAPTLRPQHTFTIAFTPKLERGTRILVQFRTASGKRSFSVFTSR